MRHRPRALLLALAAAPLALLALRADDRDLALRVWTFRLPGTELGMWAADMDADGRQDLVIAHMTSLSGPARQVSIWLQGPRGSRFEPAPARVWDVPQDACAFAAGDFHPSPGGEVALLCPDRVVLLQGPTGAPLEVLRAPGFFDYPEDGALPPWDLVHDLDGDGLPELLVPTQEGYTLLRRGGPDHQLAPAGKVALPAQHRFGPGLETTLLNRFISSTSRLRRVVALDMNGDQRLDLAAYRKRGLARFTQRADGTFPAEPDQELELEVVAAAEREDKQREGTDAFANLRINLADLDRDGRAELIATRTVGEMGMFESMRTQHYLFRGRPDGTWDQRAPGAIISLKGVSPDPELVDLDGDGRLDLAVASYRMDLLTNVKRAIFESMHIEYAVFLQRRDGAFDDDPDWSLDLEVPLSTLEKRGGAQAATFRADLDGDGVKDLVARRADGALRVRRGRREGNDLSFPEQGERVVSVGSTEPPWVVDLDGDGADELVLEPFGGDDARARTVHLVGVAR